MFKVKHISLAIDKEYKEELGKSYNCDLCDSGDWHSETEVEIHKRAFHKKKLEKIVQQGNSCMTCSLHLDSEEALIAHLKREHFYSSDTAQRIEREIFICHDCNDIYFNKDLLVLHLMHKHRKTVHPVTACPLCPRRLKPKYVYAHMMAKHNFQSISVCPICLSKRPNRKELLRHTNSHLKYYTCNICGYMSTRERDFNQHLEKYKSQERTPVTKYSHCFLPTKYKPRYKNWFSYVRVRPAMHGVVIPEKIRVCILCREICTEDEMKCHVERVHSSPAAVANLPLKCSCGEEFSTGILLKHHIFKMKGDHRALSREQILESLQSTRESNETPEEEIQYEIEIKDAVSDDENDLVIVPEAGSTDGGDV